MSPAADSPAAPPTPAAGLALAVQETIREGTWRVEWTAELGQFDRALHAVLTAVRGVDFVGFGRYSARVTFAPHVVGDPGAQGALLVEALSEDELAYQAARFDLGRIAVTVREELYFE